MNRTDLLRQAERPRRAPAAAGLLPSGSLALDVLLGGGLPGGSVCELAGPPDITQALAYRAIAAAQADAPGAPVVLCARDYDPRLAARHGADPGRILVTRDPAGPAGSGARLAVLDRPFDAAAPFRRDARMTVLVLTRHTGYQRSAACIGVSGTRGCWASAELFYCSSLHPADSAMRQLPACTGSYATAQEILYLAARLGIASVRASRYSWCRTQIGHGWENAVRKLAGDPALRQVLLRELAQLIPLYPGWRQAYA